MSPAGRVVVDTGVLLAAADADDRWHPQASAVLQERAAGQLVLPTPVAVEAAWLIGSRLGTATEKSLVASVARQYPDDQVGNNFAAGSVQQGSVSSAGLVPSSNGL